MSTGPQSPERPTRAARIRKLDAERAFKAARAAGYSRARVIYHDDGKLEFVGEDGPAQDENTTSAFTNWKKKKNAREN